MNMMDKPNKFARIRASDAHKYCSNPVLLFAEL